MACECDDCLGKVAGNEGKVPRKRMVQLIVGMPKRDMSRKFKAEADLRNLELHPDWYKRHAMKVGTRWQTFSNFSHCRSPLCVP